MQNGLMLENKISKLQNEEELKLKNYVSANIVERTTKEKLKTHKRKEKTITISGAYKIGENDTHVSHILAFKLISGSFIKYDDKKYNTTSYNIKNLRCDSYVFKTSTFNNFYIDYAQSSNIIFSINSKPGNSGNLLGSISVVRNEKFLSRDMIDVIDRARIIIITKMNDVHYSIPIDSMEEWKYYTEELSLTYVPVRVYIKNVSPTSSIMFYIKKINADITKEFSNVIDFHKNKNKCEIETYKATYIKKEFGINMSDYYDVTNNNYSIVLVDGKLEKIYIYEDTLLYFPYETDNEFDFSVNSFYKKSVTKKSNGLCDLVEIIDLVALYYDMYSDTSYCRFTKLDFFAQKIKPIVNQCILSTVKNSSLKNMILGIDDEKMMEKLTNLKSNYFKITPFIEDNTINYGVTVKHNKKIKIMLYKRVFNLNTKQNIETNETNQFFWFNCYAKNYNTQREFICSLLFLEELINDLVKKKHTNITIELEKIVKKKNIIDNKKNYGFIDAYVHSTLNNDKFAQSFEFKVDYSKPTVFIEDLEQANNYDILYEYVNINNINNSYKYKHFDYNKVVSINLANHPYIK